MSSRKDKKLTVFYPRLRYLGTISGPEQSEYGFQLENQDKSLRLIVVTIPSFVFLSRQLLVQEAPDLCYQKLMAYLRDDPAGPAEDYISISDSDIEHYRDSRTTVKARGKTRQRQL